MYCIAFHIPICKCGLEQLSISTTDKSRSPVKYCLSFTDALSRTAPVSIAVSASTQQRSRSRYTPSLSAPPRRSQVGSSCCSLYRVSSHVFAGRGGRTYSEQKHHTRLSAFPPVPPSPIADPFANPRPSSFMVMACMSSVGARYSRSNIFSGSTRQ